MKKIEKLNLYFEKPEITDPVSYRNKFEKLHDKINECVRAINLMRGHYEAGDLPIHVDWGTGPAKIIVQPFFSEKLDEHDDEEFKYTLGGERIIKDPGPTVFWFEQVNMAVIAKGKYEIEKWRLPVKKIKVGYELHQEFFSFLHAFLSCTGKNTLKEGVDLDDIKLFEAKVFLYR